MKLLLFAVCVVFAFGGVSAQTGYLAAIARTHASADMAGARCPMRSLFRAGEFGNGH